MLYEDISNDFDARAPVGAVLLAGFGIDLFEAVWTSGYEAEPDVLASGSQFPKPFCLPLPLASLRHGYIEQIHPCLPHQTNGQAAGDALVVRVRREEQRLGGLF